MNAREGERNGDDATRDAKSRRNADGDFQTRMTRRYQRVGRVCSCSLEPSSGARACDSSARRRASPRSRAPVLDQVRAATGDSETRAALPGHRADAPTALQVASHTAALHIVPGTRSDAPTAAPRVASHRRGRARLLVPRAPVLMRPTAEPPGSLPWLQPSTRSRPKGTRSDTPTETPPGGHPTPRGQHCVQAPVLMRPLKHLQFAILAAHVRPCPTSTRSDAPTAAPPGALPSPRRCICVPGHPLARGTSGS